MNIDDVAASGLISEGSRVRYALLVAGDEQSVNDFDAAIQPELPDAVRSSNREESSER